jgi:hypothetical protein
MIWLLRAGTYANWAWSGARKLGEWTGLVDPTGAAAEADRREREAERNHAKGYNQAVGMWTGLGVSTLFLSLHPELVRSATDGLDRLLTFESKDPASGAVEARDAARAAEPEPAPRPSPTAAEPEAHAARARGVEISMLE